MPEIELTSSAGMQDGDTFSSRLDAGTVVDGSHIGQMEIGVQAGDNAQERIRALEDEVNRLLDRITALERDA